LGYKKGRRRPKNAAGPLVFRGKADHFFTGSPRLQNTEKQEIIEEKKKQRKEKKERKALGFEERDEVEKRSVKKEKGCPKIAKGLAGKSGKGGQIQIKKTSKQKEKEQNERCAATRFRMRRLGRSSLRKKKHEGEKGLSKTSKPTKIRQAGKE